MISFRDVLPYLVIAGLVGLSAGAFAWEIRAFRRTLRRHRANRCPIPARTLAMYPARLACYAIIGWMPGKRPLPDRYTLSAGDEITFGNLERLYLERGLYADDPMRERGRSR